MTAGNNTDIQNTTTSTTNNPAKRHPRNPALLSAQSLKIKQTVTIPTDNDDHHNQNSNVGDHTSTPWTMAETEQEDSIYQNGDHNPTNDNGKIHQKDSFGLEELLAIPSTGSADNAADRYQQEKIQQLREQQLKEQQQKDQKGKLIVDNYLQKHHQSTRHIISVEQQNNNNNDLKKKKNMKKLDEYGFIVNIDDRGTIRSEESFYMDGGASTPAMDFIPPPESSGHNNGNSNNNSSRNRGRFRRKRQNNNNGQNGNHNPGDTPPSFVRMVRSPSDPTSSPKRPANLTKAQRRDLKIQKKLTQRREKKWNQMIEEYPSIIGSKPKRKKLYSRVRKGIPNSIRGKAWVTMAKVDLKIKAMNGVYADLVEQSCADRFDGIHEALVPFVVEGQNGGTGSDENGEDEKLDSSILANGDPTADIMKETIERDINRTFPRHSMFYDSYSDSDDDDSVDSVDVVDKNAQGDYYDSNNSLHGETYEPQSDINRNKIFSHGNDDEDDDGELSDESFDKVSFSGSLGSTGHGISITDNMDSNAEFMEHENHASGGLNGVVGENTWSKAFQTVAAKCPPGLCRDSKKGNALFVKKPPTPPLPPSAASTPSRKAKKKVDIAIEEGGQASLRRVLRAYSLYDPEVGYCQGMNFIAGMFITFVTEEEAFWLLVYVMNEKPCRMRGLFSIGMSEAHQVLNVAEKLIAQFTPKLSKHFDNENIHVTMFATQWLLTMFTSSFPFHIVTRVWDCFILEGWKVTYRVMLALLDKATPELLKLRFEDILNAFKVLPFQMDVNNLFVSSFNVKLKKKHIEKYAKEWLRKQEIEKLQKLQNQKNRG